MKNFRGWKTVFGFTFRQSISGLGFKLVTALVAVAIIAVLIAVNIIAAKPDKDSNEPSPIKTAYIQDNSGLSQTNYEDFIVQSGNVKFNQVTFTNTSMESRTDVIKEAVADSDHSIAVFITEVEEGYNVEAVIPKDSAITKSQAKALVDVMSAAFNTNKLMQSGLTSEQLNAVMKPAVTSFSNVGEDNNTITTVIKMIAPMIFGLLLYMMLLIYGQTVSKSVSTEKTSKLMETLLTSIHPYALITGKILAVTTMAVAQFVSWIVAVVVGLYGGNLIAHNIYPDYENSVITVINFFKDNIGETALSLPAVILAILFFCVGFLFYCVLAGLAGCMVTKPEDASSTQTIFVFPVLISWLISYFAPVMQKEGLTKVLRFIPFTSPFSVPVDLITGSVGLIQGIISLFILLLFSLLIIMLSAKIYKGLVLYNGQKVNFKMLGNILKANKG